MAAASLSVVKHVDAQLSVLWLAGRLDKNARFRRYADGLEGDVIFILGDVTGADADGYARLKEALDSAPGASLARVPPCLAPYLAKDEAPPPVLSWLDGERPEGLTLPLASLTPSTARYLASHDFAPSSDVVAEPTKAISMEGLAEVLPDAGQSLHDTAPPPSRIGKIDVVRRLGKGGMAEVFLGRQRGPEGFEKRVVVKRILPHLAIQSRFVKMFTQEARIAARISHSNVVQIFDLCREGGEFYIVMEYVDGWDLRSLLKLAVQSRTRLPVEFGCGVIADVCAGLHAAHSFVDDSGKALPVLHRDVSPHNILIGRDGRAKLADFGIAKAADAVRTTATGVLRGKVHYLAPESVKTGQLDARSDVYAAGLVLYMALTLRHPFAAVKGEAQVMAAIVEKPIVPAQELRKDLDDDIAQIVARAMERDPDKRFQSARELETALENALASRGHYDAAASLNTFLDALAPPRPAQS